MELSVENLESTLDGHFAQLAAALPMGIADTDSRGKIIFINTQGEALIRSAPGSGHTPSANFHDYLLLVAPSLLTTIQAFSAATGRIVTEEIHGTAMPAGAEAREYYLSFTVDRLAHGGCRFLFADVTDRRHKDKLLQQMIADRTIMQGRFEITANVLHDIGNALVGFGSYLNRMKHTLEQENTANLLNLADYFNSQQAVLSPVLGEAKTSAVIKILSGIAQMQKTHRDDISESISEQQNIITHIQEILNIHRQYIHGQDSQEKRQVSVTAIIRDCLAMLQASFQKRSIALTVDVPEVLPVIRGDRTRLMQVILNILKNSIEAINVYSPFKSIDLRVQVEPGWMIIRIVDSGHGFAPQTGEQLFKRGFTTKSSGSGLGLSSCRAIVEAHEGEITIESEGEGKGATTTIKLKT